MSKTVSNLRVALGLDSAKFSRGLSDAQKSLASAQRQFAAISGVATVALGAITAAALKGAQAIDENAKAARRLDTSVASYRALEMAADDAGVSLSSLANDVQTMNREIVKETQASQDALKALGLSAGDLANLDADQKLALIADQVKTLGLDSAETSGVLQQLGVRNREMALLVLSGGDALRAARQDVEEFGLAISDIDAARIEAANDELAGLADITSYIGDQLALKFVPALGEMAKAMTDSLREGGTLRAVIDGLIGSLDRIAAYTTVVVAGLGVRYVSALAAARFATGLLTGSLALLRTALIRTGIGAAVVALGELALWLSRAREATGSFGDAFKMIALQVKAASLNMKAFFIESIGSMVSKFVEFTNVVADGLNGLFGSNLRGMDATITQVMNRSAISARDAAGVATKAANSLRIELDAAGETAVDVSDSIETIAEAADAAGTAGRGAGAATKASLDEAAEAAEQATTALQDMASQGVDAVAQAFADFTVRAFKDFKSLTDSIISSFKQMISQLIATAIANPIKIAMGMGSSLAGTAAQAGQAAAGGTGLLAGVGGLGGLGSAFMGGAGFFTSGVASGGIGGGISAIGTALSGATGGIGGLAAAAGALALPLAGLGIVIAGLIPRTKTLDSGIKVSVDSIGATVREFERVQKSRFFGLSKSTSTNTSAADAATAEPIIAAVASIQSGVREAAAALNIGSDVFDEFTASVQISLRGLSEEQALAEIQNKLGAIGDQFANMIPGIDGYLQAGEGSIDALNRLATSLTVANQQFGNLGFSLNDVSLSGAAASSAFVQLFGSLDQFVASTDFYFANFYSNAEIAAASAENLSAAFMEMNLTAPQTAAEFRSLVGALQSGSAAMQAQAAKVIQLAPAFVANQEAQAKAITDPLVVAADAAVKAAKAQVAAARAQTRAAQDQLKAAKESAAAQEKSAIDQERFALETRYLQALGNEAALKERAIAAFASSNQAFARMVMGVEDARKAADALSEVDFASLVDFNRAQGRALNMVPANFNLPVPPVMTTSVPAFSASTVSAASGALTPNDEKELLRLLSLIERNTKDVVRGVEDLVDMGEDAA